MTGAYDGNIVKIKATVFNNGGVHSMGGPISRFYIHNFTTPVYDNKPEVTHLVMLGTPNQGSACAHPMYGVYNSRVFEKPVEALRRLKPSVVGEYNKKTYNRKNVKFSILAGFGAGPTCGLEIGDGVVPLSSALYNVVDREYAGTHHLARRKSCRKNSRKTASQKLETFSDLQTKRRRKIFGVFLFLTEFL